MARFSLSRSATRSAMIYSVGISSRCYHFGLSTGNDAVPVLALNLAHVLYLKRSMGHFEIFE